MTPPPPCDHDHPFAGRYLHQHAVRPATRTKLRAVLALLRYDAAAHEHPPTAHVFGHAETGERVASIKTAWRLACRRAGVRGLRFHDLRREFACRLLESRAELHDVRAFLGHANIATTSRYLQATPVRLERALARMEAPEPEPASATEPTPVQPSAAPLPPVPASVN